MNWTGLVLIICCLVAVFAVWKEFMRARKANLILRVVASLVAVASLACITIPLTYIRDASAIDDHDPVLLTTGFTPDSLKNYKNSKLFTADRTIAKAYPKAKLIRLDELKADSPAIAKLNVFGYGLNKDELTELGNIPVSFHSSPHPGGFTAVNWNQNLNANETLSVQGEYRNTHSGPVKLVLTGLNTQLDTITISAGAKADFELNTIPKNAGRWFYSC